MKKIVSIIILLMYLPLYAKKPLVVVANKELNYSKSFLRYERYQQRDLYALAKLLKKRYILTKEEKWLSNKITNAIYLQSTMISLTKENTDGNN